MSDETNKETPSTKKQLALAEYIAKELCNMGIENAHVDEKGYVYPSVWFRYLTFAETMFILLKLFEGH